MAVLMDSDSIGPWLDKSAYEYYAHVIINTQNLAQDDFWGPTLGLQDLNGAMIFDLQELRGSWDALDFNPGC